MWGLLVLNTVPFYPDIKLVIPIPLRIGQAVTQGALVMALLLALTVNRRIDIRPNVFLCMVTLLVIEATLTVLQTQYVLGTTYRTVRFIAFVIVLWLLTPWWGRRDLLLLRSHIVALAAILGSVLLGLAVDPGEAFSARGRLTGVLWPIFPTQVAHFAAVMTGLITVLWLGGLLRGRVTLLISVVGVGVILLTHTRTAVVAMVAGILVAGLGLFMVRSRARRFVAAITVAVSAGMMTAASAVTVWWTRGQSAQELATLSGRTNFWAQVLSLPRNTFQQIFGFGLSNGSINGRPIDSNWLVAYMNQGIFGILVCAAMLLFLLVAAFFEPPGSKRALALFLVTYLLIASLTEVGFTDPTTYLLELTLTASLLGPAMAKRRRVPALEV